MVLQRWVALGSSVSMRELVPFSRGTEYRLWSNNVYNDYKSLNLYNIVIKSGLNRCVIIN